MRMKSYVVLALLLVSLLIVSHQQCEAFWFWGKDGNDGEEKGGGGRIDGEGGADTVGNKQHYL